MTEDQTKILTNLRTSQEEITAQWIDYWLEYSFLDTWQFWFILSCYLLHSSYFTLN
jgi:hypothetical protein